MARGWESKDVESQVEQAESRRVAASALALAADELWKRTHVEGLLLSRTRVYNDLTASVHARRRVQLEAALAHLDRELTALGWRPSER